MIANRTFRRSSALALALALTAGLAVAGTPVKLEDVPKPAVKAVQDRFTKAAIRSIDKETNGHFEFTMREGERVFDVGVKADGTLIDIKEEIKEDKVPKAVKEGLQKKHPGATIVETEKVIVIDGKKEKVTYELKIKVEKKTLEVILDEAGAAFVAPVQEAKDVDKIPKAVIDALKVKFPNAKIFKWTIETAQDGKTKYWDLEFSQEGVNCEADILEDGTYIDFQKPVALKDLPAVVKAAVEAKYPKCTIQEAHEITEVKDKKESLAKYEVIFETADKQKVVELEVTPDGKVVAETVLDDKKEGKKEPEAKDLDKIPKAVMDALKAKFPKARITQWVKHEVMGVYDIEFTVDGVHGEAEIKVDGTYVKHEKEIVAKDLPEAVKKAVDAKYPKATLKKIKEITVVKDKKEMVGEYEIILESADQQLLVELLVDPDGKIVAEEVLRRKK